MTFLVQDIQLPNELNFPDVLIRAATNRQVVWILDLEQPSDDALEAGHLFRIRDKYIENPIAIILATNASDEAIESLFVSAHELPFDWGGETSTQEESLGRGSLMWLIGKTDSQIKGPSRDLRGRLESYT